MNECLAILFIWLKGGSKVDCRNVGNETSVKNIYFEFGKESFKLLEDVRTSLDQQHLWLASDSAWRHWEPLQASRPLWAGVSGLKY